MLEEFTDKVIGTVEQEVTENDILNIVVTALEGGSNYWLGLDNTTPEWKDKPKGEPLSTWTAKILLDSNEVRLYDIEGTEDVPPLTLPKLLEGIRLNAKHRPSDANLDDIDGACADCIIQYALFGKVVFG